MFVKYKRKRYIVKNQKDFASKQGLSSAMIKLALFVYCLSFISI